MSAIFVQGKSLFGIETSRYSSNLEATLSVFARSRVGGHEMSQLVYPYLVKWIDFRPYMKTYHINGLFANGVSDMIHYPGEDAVLFPGFASCF